MSDKPSRCFRTISLPLCALALLALVGSLSLWLQSARHQYALNRALIAVLVKGDNKQALALVDEGADPNTRYEPLPAPTLKLLWDHLRHPSSSVFHNNPTALLIACGAWWGTQSAFPDAQADSGDHTKLVEAMLSHGANINVEDEAGSTPLLWALNADLKNTVAVLLEHGANVNTKTDERWTPLMVAARSSVGRDTVPLLLERGGEVNARDKDGGTALTWAVWSGKAKDIIRLLLAHGADPNLADKNSDSPIIFAQRGHRPDIVDLLKQAGGKK